MSDGRQYLRQICTKCHLRIGGALPMIADRDVSILSSKGKTLGEIQDTAPEYLRWIVQKSKASLRIKKAAARLLMGVPYVPRKNNEVIPFHESYDSTISADFVNDIKNNKI